MMWHEIIGWIGAFLFITAYLLLTLKFFLSTEPLYHILNILGACCLVINASMMSDFPNIFVNSVWGIIGIYATIRILLIKR